MQKREFVYQARAGRVVFGPGSLQHLEREVLQLNSERALILCSPEQKETGEAVAARLGSRAAAVFDRAVMQALEKLAYFHCFASFRRNALSRSYVKVLRPT